MKISKQIPAIHNIPVDKSIEKKDILPFKEKISISTQPQESKKIENEFFNTLEGIANEVFKDKINSMPQATSKVVETVLKNRFSADLHNTKFFIEMNSTITNFIQQDPVLNKQLEATLAKLAKG